MAGETAAVYGRNGSESAGDALAASCEYAAIASSVCTIGETGAKETTAYTAGVRRECRCSVECAVAE